MNQPKKILFLINNLGTGGAEKVFVNDANFLAENGYQVYFAILYSDKLGNRVSDLKLDPDNIWKLGFKNIYNLRSYKVLIGKIKEERIDIVYSTLDEANLVAKICRVFTTFKLFCREANMTFDKPLKFKIIDVVLNSLVYKLVMVAKAVRDSYATYDPLRKSKMEVLYNGVDLPLIQDKQINNSVKILAIGSFTPKKGFMDLIEIIKDYVVPKQTNFTLEVIGNGILLEKIREKIKEWKMEDRVFCPGKMDQSAIMNKYKEADIFVLTSKKEGCPNVLLEAMAYGVAPVSFSVGAVPEIINNGISGIVVPPADKVTFGRELVGLMQKSDKIKAMGLEARREIENRFSDQIHQENLIKTLEL